MPATEIFTVTPEQAGQRLDKLLQQLFPDSSRSGMQKLLERGLAELDGRRAGKNDRPRAGQQLVVTLPDPQPLDVLPQAIPLDIVYEDASLLVVNKPKGMVVHPAPGNPDGTLVNALLAHCGSSLSGIGGVIRPGIVHRIDKDTSGLLAVAKTDRAHQSLAAQIQSHAFERFYEAVVYGGFREESGTVDLPIGRSQKDRKKMAVNREHGRPAVTHFEVLERLGRFSHLRLQLETGRTHQIRVHMAQIGHPLAGDAVYGPRACITQLQGQCLHACTISFRHPDTGVLLRFSSPLPAYFTNFLNQCRHEVER